MKLSVNFQFFNPTQKLLLIISRQYPNTLMNKLFNQHISSEKWTFLLYYLSFHTSVYIMINILLSSTNEILDLISMFYLVQTINHYTQIQRDRREKKLTEELEKKAPGSFSLEH